MKKFLVFLLLAALNIAVVSPLSASAATKFIIELYNCGADDPGSESVQATAGEVLPPITPPSKANYSFAGYYTGRNGRGQKIYNADGTSDVTAVLGRYFELYAYWEFTEATMKGYAFDYRISEPVLNNYLGHAVTLSSEGSEFRVQNQYIKNFILNTGTKYVCRANTSWVPSEWTFSLLPAQTEMINQIHAVDPDVVFEACVFECISSHVNELAIPDYVFEAFDCEPEERNFNYEDMIFPDGKYVDTWGTDRSVPDVTQFETQLFIYYCATRYIDAGYEAIHFGQVRLIGQDDKNYEIWTDLLQMVRDYAALNARRHMVLCNAHEQAKGTDGISLFDFNMYPCRPASDYTQEPHAPTEDNPQRAYLEVNYIDSLYFHDYPATTFSGWETGNLPYLVEVDNFGYNAETLFTPTYGAFEVWGMDEISWFANQPDDYRHEWLEYAVKWIHEYDGEAGHMALPAQRTAYIFDSNKNIIARQYMAYDKSNNPNGWGDESTVKKLFKMFDIRYGVFGDVDGADEDVTSTDALLALQQSIKMIDLNDIAAAKADVDGNGEVTSTDSLLILQKSIKKIEKFPVEN